MFDEITMTDWIAIIALALSTGSLFLEIRRWFESGVRLKLTYMVDTVFIVEGEGITEPDKRRIYVEVSNRGDAPTTLTNLTFIYHPTILDELRYNFSRSFIRRILPCSEFWKYLDSARSENFLYHGLNPAESRFPFLEPGRRWKGTAVQDEEIDKKLNKGRLWLRIHANHTDKPVKILLRRRKKLESKELKSG